MSTEKHQEVQEVWADDLFKRQPEADLLEAYIESVAARQTGREDVHAFTIAIDCGYGEGKTFFLRRFAKQLAAKHPVAFVDAWRDDLADEPLVALAATLQRAIGPLKKKSSTVQGKWSAVIKAGGEVAKVVAGGLIRRGVGVVITGQAVDAVEEIMSGASDGLREATDAAAKTSGKDVVDSAEKVIKKIAPQKLMQSRIAAFEAGQAAIDQMKQSLVELVESLNGDIGPPIVIIVDELDRCRPTYSLKLLEEIKHVFDVPGLVFVFGMHGNQLARSISGAYGADFDGEEYLRRFVGRRYRLKTPHLQPLVTKLLGSAGITTNDFLAFDVVADRADIRQVAPDVLITQYMTIYQVSAREVFQLVDMLQTCVALVRGERLVLPYLLPMMIAHLRGAKPGELTAPAINNSDWAFALYPAGGSRSTYTFFSLAEQLHQQFQLRERDLRHQQGGLPSFAYELRARAKNRLADPSNYAELIATVGRFSNPALDEAG